MQISKSAIAGLFLSAAALLTQQGIAQSSNSSWVGSWAASQQIPEPANTLQTEDLHDATLRETVHLSLGGSMLRVHLSNAFGTTALHLDTAHVAMGKAGAISPASDHTLLFDGQTSVTIPPGAEYISDPLTLAVAPFSDMTVSLHYDQAPAQQTGHPGARATAYLAPGNQVAAQNLLNAKTFEHWYQLAEIDVMPAGSAVAHGAVIALGDSITDGHGSTLNGNDRWPDVLAQLLVPHGMSVLNEGIGGNHLLTDGLGPNILARLDRDMLAPVEAHTVIVLEGVNDLGGLTRDAEVSPETHSAMVHRMEGAYQQTIDRAHARGMRIIGGTILPYTGSDYYHPGPASEQDRLAVNAWIMAPGHFDAVIDFSKATADPAHPDRLQPAYDSGDHLHPSPAGYRVMAQAAYSVLFP